MAHLVGISRSRTTKVERTHGQLGTRFTDGLSRDDTDGIAMFRQITSGQIAAIAFATDTAFAFAGQHGTDEHLVDTHRHDAFRQFSRDFLSGRDQHFASSRVVDVFGAETADDTVFQLHGFFRSFLDRLHVDAVGGSLGGNTHHVVIQTVVVLSSVDLLDSSVAILMRGHEDNETLAGIIDLVVDNLLDVLLGLLFHVPGVALCPDGVGAVVVQIVEDAAVAVVHEGVVTGVVVLGITILGFAQVDIGCAGNDSNAPQATFHPVALDVDVALAAAVIDADAAAAVSGGVLVAVVNNLVVLDESVNAADGSDAITVLGDIVVLNIEFAGMAHTHHVAHADATREVKLTANHLVANDVHVVIASAGHVNLGLVAVAGGVVPEEVVADDDAHGVGGATTDGVDSVLDEIAVLDDVVVTRGIEGDGTCAR